MTDDAAGHRFERLERRLDAAESVLAIQDLKARYAALVDARFARGPSSDRTHSTLLARRAAELFTEDGVWDGGPGLGVARGRAEIAARLAEPTLVFSAAPLRQASASTSTATGPRGGGTCCARAPAPTGRRCGCPATRTTPTPGSTGVWLHARCPSPPCFVSPAGEGWPRILA